MPCKPCNIEFASKAKMVHHFFEKHVITPGTVKDAYKCESCEDLVGNDELAAHAYSHTDQNRFECYYCKETFKTKRLLATHRYVCKKSIPEKNVQDEADDDAIVIKEEKKVNMATRLPSTIVPVTCEICKRVYPNKSCFLLHFIKNHLELLKPEAQYSCTLCDYRTHAQTSMKPHAWRMHSEGMGYMCKLCGHTLKQRRAASIHRCQLMATQQRSEVHCQLCDQVLPPVDKTLHVKTCPKVREKTTEAFLERNPEGEVNHLLCTICGHTQVSLRDMIWHAAVAGGHFKVNTLPQLPESTTKDSSVCPEFEGWCTKCEELGCVSRIDYLSHFFREHCSHCDFNTVLKARARANNKAKRTVERNPDGYQCHLCVKWFKAKALLMSHLRKKHSLGDKPHKSKPLESVMCELCSKICRSREGLRYHQLTQHSGKMQVCEVCGAKYKSPGSLAFHMAKHSDATPFVCDICGRGFKRKRTLLTHKQYHKGKTFECQHCGKAFFFQWEQRKHIRQKHPDFAPIP